jgi:hypothetical protein
MIGTGSNLPRQLREAEGLICEGSCEVFTGCFDELAVLSVSATRRAELVDGGRR